MIITIDGPVASGKSTIARALAKKLHFFYLNTGLLFRATAYVLLNIKEYSVAELKNIDSFDWKELTQLFTYKYVTSETAHIFVKQHDITHLLVDPLIAQAASIISVNSGLRQELAYVQRALITSENNAVIEGRDSGSIVFNRAHFKFFLTASIEVRAERWKQMQEERGSYISLETAFIQVNERDERDMRRLEAPLIIPQEGIVIDTSYNSIEQVLQKIILIIEQKGA